jgi:hypothetical protein
MLQIILGEFRDDVPEGDDLDLPRTFAGWREGMSEQDVLTAARGWWVLNRSRAEHERYAVISAQGLGRLVVEITGTEWATRADGRHAFNGAILPRGHPVHDRYVGQPVPPSHGNPVQAAVQAVAWQDTACRYGVSGRAHDGLL